MKCSSLASDGSDFIISSGASVVSASSYCSGFDMDSLVIGLSNPLPPGNYNIIIQDGTDGNTLVDNCENQIPVGNSLPLTIVPLAPTPMDSLTALQCAPQSLQLVFKKNILCSSVAPDGSDFVVTGPSTVTVVSAVINCPDNSSKLISFSIIQTPKLPFPWSAATCWTYHNRHIYRSPHGRTIPGPPLKFYHRSSPAQYRNCI